MKVMIVKLRQKGKTIRQISIVLIVVLLIVFLAAPASAVTCVPKYSAYKKVITNVGTETKETLVLTYRIPGIKPAVTLRLYIKYQRTVTKWQMERTKTTYTYCTKTKKCEISGTPTIQVGTKGTTYGTWVAISYRTTIT